MFAARPLSDSLSHARARARSYRASRGAPQVHKYAEEGRNGLRQVRRDANERLKKLLKDHAISEDDERRALDEVQKATDAHVATVDDLQKKKDAELLNR